MKTKAGLIPFIETDDGIKMCFMKSSDSAYGGSKWQISKGHMDPGEKPLATAVREAEEELGVKKSNMSNITLVGKFKLRGDVEEYYLHIYKAHMKTDKLGRHDSEVGQVKWLTPKEFASSGRNAHIPIVKKAS
jgi:8-oxo-dGTP pyrophosphatase MutT (NUDIX family)